MSARATGTGLGGLRELAGTLWPFAAKALPNAVRGPPPAGLTWQRPQAKPVCCVRRPAVHRPVEG